MIGLALLACALIVLVLSLTLPLPDSQESGSDIARRVSDDIRRDAHRALTDVRRLFK